MGCRIIPATCVRYLSRLGDTVAAALDGLLKQTTPTTVSNAVAGATVMAPDLVKPWQPVAVDFSQHGAIRLPPLASVPENFAYLFYRAITGSAGLVEVVPAVNEFMDGRAVEPGNPVNGGAYLVDRSAVGTPLIVRASKGTWVSSGGFIASPQDSILADTTLTVWAGHREAVINSATGRTLTLPSTANVVGQGMPRGSRLTAVAFLGSHTIAAAGTGRFYGSVNGAAYNAAVSIPLAAQSSVTIEYFSPFIWIVGA